MTAMLAVSAPRRNIDPVHVTGASLALMLNLVVLALLLRPPPWEPMAAREAKPFIVVPDFTPPPPPPLPPEPVANTAPSQPAPTIRLPSPPPVEIPTPGPIDFPAPAFTSEIQSAPALATGAATAAASGPTLLEYVEAPPPPYPTIALRRGQEGTVWLYVLVDEAGKPVQVRVERSSGHRVLDNVARQQVLNRWRFRPAQHEGQAVAAWARVPVSFRLIRE